MQPMQPSLIYVCKFEHHQLLRPKQYLFLNLKTVSECKLNAAQKIPMYILALEPVYEDF